LSSTPLSDPTVKRFRAAFLEGLREYGWVEGQNLLIESRWVEGHTERYGSYAAELVSRGDIELIVAVGTQATIEAKTRTTTIPILMLSVSHPVGAGLVTSLARPGGNVTGITSQLGDIEKASSFCANWCRTCTAFSCCGNPTTQGHDWALRT
jgi:putative ABC transport system substrate-binding protein